MTFTVTATTALGPASVVFTAAQKETTQSSEATLSIRPATAKETTLRTGYSKDGDAKIDLTRVMYPEFAERSVTVSGLPTSYIHGLLRYLNEFPYGCSEQLISKAFPQISLYGQPEFSVGEEKMQQAIDDTVAMLRQRQTDDGGIALWDGNTEADSFISTYALDFLIHARNANLPVPADLIESDLRYLRNWVNQTVNSTDEARTKAYAIYVLTSSGMVTTNEILHLLKYFEEEKDTSWKTDLTAVYLASSYKLMQQTDLANETIAAFEKGISADDMNYKEQASDPFVRYAQYVSLLAAHFPERFAKLDQEIVFTLARYIDEQYYSTLSSSYAIQALQDYATLATQNLAEGKPQFLIDGNAVEPTGETVLSADLPVTATKLAIKGTDAPLFYSLSETGFDKTPQATAIDQKMEVSRTYLGADGKELTGPVEIGAVIDAVIKIRTHEDIIDNVAIVDLFPGGFELDADSAGAGSSLAADSIDKREDRIIAFGTIGTDEQTFRYKLRAVSKGTFLSPAPYAEAMYDVTAKARGTASALTVTDPR